MTVIRRQLAEQAKTWLDVSYEHRGITRFGCDCTGLIIGCLRELGYMQHYHLREYPFQWNLHGGAGDYICEEVVKIADLVPNHSPKPGDIVVFRFARCRAHAGLIVAAPKFIHALSSNEKVCWAVLAGRQWAKRWERTYRINADKLGRYT